MKRTSNVFLFGLAVISATIFTSCSSNGNKQATPQNGNPEEAALEQEEVEYIPDGYSSLFEHIDFYADTEEGKTLCFQILSPNTCGVTYKDKGRNEYEYNYDHYVAGTVTIPEKIKFEGDIYTVVSILPHAFDKCAKLGKVNLPSTIETLCECSFQDCKGLSSITIPESVSTIEWKAFHRCTSLASITILNGVEAIGSCAFFHCSSLTSIKIPDSVTRIGSGAFSGCTSLASITISNGIDTIEDSAFVGCKSLTSIKIPDSVTHIGRGAFGGCSSLTSIVLPKKIEEVAPELFQFCKSLKSVTIPDGVTRIGWNVFLSCESLTSVTYNGTTTQWQTIEKSGWLKQSQLRTVHCTDGDINFTPDIY